MIGKAFVAVLVVGVLCGLIAPAGSADGPDVRSYYTSTLNELEATYGVRDVATQGDRSANDLMGYEMVIWFTGYPWSDTFTPADEAAVAAYLDAEGRFWLVSED